MADSDRAYVSGRICNQAGMRGHNRRSCVRCAYREGREDGRAAAQEELVRLRTYVEQREVLRRVAGRLLEAIINHDGLDPDSPLAETYRWARDQMAAPTVNEPPGGGSG